MDKCLKNYNLTFKNSRLFIILLDIKDTREKREHYTYTYIISERYLTKGVFLYLPVLGETERKRSNPWFPVRPRLSGEVFH